MEGKEGEIDRMINITYDFFFSKQKYFLNRCASKEKYAKNLLRAEHFMNQMEIL